MVVRPGIIALKFDEKPFFSIILGFTLNWDYEHYNNYISQKSINLSTMKKIFFKCEVIDGIVLNGLRQPILFSFILDKPPEYRVFFEPETIH